MIATALTIEFLVIMNPTKILGREGVAVTSSFRFKAHNDAAVTPSREVHNDRLLKAANGHVQIAERERTFFGSA